MLELEKDRILSLLNKSGIPITNTDNLIKDFENAISTEYRTQHGVVYTPQWVADIMVDRVISKYSGDITQIKICDPCCGAGVYEFAILKCLIARYNKIGDTRDILELSKYIIENNIYAFDIDYNSIEITKFRLWAYLVELGYTGTLDSINFHIYHGNSIDSSFEGLWTNYDYELKLVDNEIIKSIHLDTWQEKFRNFNDISSQSKTGMKYWKASVELINQALQISADLRGDGEIPLLYSVAMARNKFKNNLILWYADFADIFYPNGLDSGNVGGFDIVIGNPPYVRDTESIETATGEIVDTLSVYKGVHSSTADLYLYFYELGYLITKSTGIISFITPNKWFRASYAKQFRNWAIDKITEIYDFNMSWVFDNAYTTVAIVEIDKSVKSNIIKYSNIQSSLSDKIVKYDKTLEISRDILDTEGFIFAPVEIYGILNKLNTFTKLSDISGVRIIKGEVVKGENRLSTGRIPLVKGEDVPYPGDELNIKIYTDLDLDISKYQGCIVIPEVSKITRAYRLYDAIPLDSNTVLYWDSEYAVDYFNNPIIDDIYAVFYCTNYMTGYAQIRFPRKTGNIGNLPVPDKFTGDIQKDLSLTDKEVEILRRYRNDYCGC